MLTWKKAWPKSCPQWSSVWIIVSLTSIKNIIKSKAKPYSITWIQIITRCLSNQAWRQGYISIAEKAFLLNKALHGIDAFYAITLPDVFLFVHPVGTVLGNASYADCLVVYQNVTVGSDKDGIYPTFGKSTVLYSKSSVIGRCKIGNNVSIAAHSFVRNMDVPDDSVVVGLYPENKIKKNNQINKRDFFM